MAVQWPLLIFSILLGASSGIMVFLGVGELKGTFKKVRFPLALAALILLVVGGCASAFHLGNIDRAFHILGNLNSGLSRELFGVGFAFIVLLVYTVLARKDYSGASKVLGVLALIAGIALPLIAGASYMMPARPIWNSATLPLMYLGTGLGLGLVIAAAVACMKGDQKDSGFALKLALTGVAVSIATVIFFVIWMAMAPYPNASRSIDRLISGDLALEFWLGTVGFGMVLPAILVALSMKSAANPKPTSGATVAVAGAEGGNAGAASATAAGAKQAAGLLWATLICLLIGNVAIRIIMYAMATSVESLIY